MSFLTPSLSDNDDTQVNIPRFLEIVPVNPSQFQTDQFHAYLIFTCPEQLNRWPCHSLTDSVTHGTLLIDIQGATPETWPDHDLTMTRPTNSPNSPNSPQLTPSHPNSSQLTQITQVAQFTPTQIILVTYDIWDTDYNSDNSEYKFMTIPEN